MKAKRFLALVLCIGMMICVLSACSPKNAQTPDGFRQTMEDANLTVKDVTATANLDEEADCVLIAYNDNYQIEFYEMVDKNTAIIAFNNVKATFKNKDASVKTSTSKSYSNYDYYGMNGGGEFHVVARIDNTLLYCVAEKEYKSEIVKHFKTLGYK